MGSNYTFPGVGMATLYYVDIDKQSSILNETNETPSFS